MVKGTVNLWWHPFYDCTLDFKLQGHLSGRKLFFSIRLYSSWTLEHSSQWDFLINPWMMFSSSNFYHRFEGKKIFRDRRINSKYVIKLRKQFLVACEIAESWTIIRNAQLCVFVITFVNFNSISVIDGDQVRLENRWQIYGPTRILVKRR